MDKVRHFTWKPQYEMDDEMLDKQHKNLFSLAEKLLHSGTKVGLLKNNKLILQHVKEWELNKLCIIAKVFCWSSFV